MACIDTRLFDDFFRDNNNLQESFMDFLEYVYTRDSSMVEKNKDGKIVAVCAEIDIEAKIDCDVACDGLVFKEKVEFDKCEFKGKISFKKCIFEKDVYLKNCKFCKKEKRNFYKKQIAVFSNNLFKKYIFFDNSTFNNNVDFRESNFMDITSFYGVKFQKVPNFSACYFKEPKAVNLVNIDINSLNFKQVECYIKDNFKDEWCKQEITKNRNKEKEIEQKYKLKSAKTIKDSFRVIKDILIGQNNTLEAQEWHKLELYAQEKELEMSLENSEYDGVVQNYATWVDYTLLKLYKHTSEHHTNLLKILNFTIGMIAIYTCLTPMLSHFKILLQLDKIYINIVCFASIFLVALFIPMKPKTRLMACVVICLTLIILTSHIINTNFGLVQLISLICYLMCLVVFYFLFTCKNRFSVFLVNLCSWTIFTIIIASAPQFINPFIGIFSNDKLFESKFEQKLSDLNSSTIINLAKLSQKEFTLQDDYNVSFAELNSAKMVVLSNKNNITALKDENLTKVAEILGDALYSEISQAIEQDRILGDIIKSTSVIYGIILLLCIFSLQKTARKNSIIPS